VELTPPAGWGLVSTTNQWDAQLDFITANKIWLVAASATTSNTIVRISAAVGAGVTWDAAVTTDRHRRRHRD